MTCSQVSRGFSLSCCILAGAGLTGCVDSGLDGLGINASLQAQSASSQDQATICDPPPTASAANSESGVVARKDGYGYVQLDATGSTAPARSELSFIWFENDKKIAAGEDILVRLSAGVHDLKLVVTDYCGNESTDTIRITVAPNVE